MMMNKDKQAHEITRQLREENNYLFRDFTVLHFPDSNLQSVEMSFAFYRSDICQFRYLFPNLFLSVALRI